MACQPATDGSIIIALRETFFEGKVNLVAAQNVAYLRKDENGQTKVGMVGGDSLLVVGTIEEIAAKISTDKAVAQPA